MYTFNNIYDALKDIATAHNQVNTFGMGDLWEMTSSGTVQYPLMWAKPEDSRIDQGVFTSSWTLLFMDLVDDGEGNENDVLSDMELVALDVIALLKNPLYDFDFKGDGITLQRFTERFEDKVAGVGIRVDLRVPYTADRCQVPQTGLNVNSGASCLPVTIYDSNGAVITTVVSGGSYTVASVSCDDATAVLLDSSGTTISSTSIASGSSANITAPDATAILINSSGGVISSTLIGSGATNYILNQQNLFWELNFNGTDDVIFIPATSSNVGTFTSGGGSNVGTITISTDGVTYGALNFNFVPSAGTTYYFKRSSATVTGVYTLTGTY